MCTAYRGTVNSWHEPLASWRRSNHPWTRRKATPTQGQSRQQRCADARPTSCRNSTASRPSSSFVSTRDILTQVRKPPENFQLE